MLIRDMIERLPNAKQWYVNYGNRYYELRDDINKIGCLRPGENTPVVEPSYNIFLFRAVRIDFNVYEWELLR